MTGGSAHFSFTLSIVIDSLITIDISANLEDLRKQQDEEENNLQVQLEELKEKRQEKLEWVEKESSRFGDLKKHVALEAINSRSGRPLTQKVGSRQAEVFSRPSLVENLGNMRLHYDRLLMDSSPPQMKNKSKKRLNRLLS